MKLTYIQVYLCISVQPYCANYFQMCYVFFQLLCSKITVLVKVFKYAISYKTPWLRQVFATEIVNKRLT